MSDDTGAARHDTASAEDTARTETAPTAREELEEQVESAERRALKNSYGLLLPLILAALAVLMLVGETGWAVSVVTFTLAATLVLALYTSDASRKLQAAGLVVAGVTVLVSLPLTPEATDWQFLAAFSLVWVVLAATASFTVLRSLVRIERVSTQAMLGVVCVFLLIGLTFMLVFGWLARVQDGTFFAQDVDAGTSDYVYFSYVTLTTLGYGDLSPATNAGRFAAVVEAVLGQIFLVVVVARFVSLWGRDLPPTHGARK